MATSNICPRTIQQAGAKANADSSKSSSETQMGQSIQTQVQPKCNTCAKQAAGQHQCQFKCNAGVSTSATQVQTQWKQSCSHLLTCIHPMQMQVQCRCKHKRNTSANAMEACRHMQTCIHPMQMQVQTQVQPQRQSADASASASISEQATNVPQLFPITPGVGARGRETTHSRTQLTSKHAPVWLHFRSLKQLNY